METEAAELLGHFDELLCPTSVSVVLDTGILGCKGIVIPDHPTFPL